MHVEQNFVVANHTRYLWETLRFSGNKINWFAEGLAIKWFVIQGSEDSKRLYVQWLLLVKICS